MLKRYGFFGSLKLVKSFLYTSIFFNQARLIRLPFDIRNKKNIKIGKNFTTGFACRIEAFPVKNSKEYCIEIGENVQINDFVHIASIHSIKIGNNVLMASKIFISDHNHGSYGDSHSDSPLTIPSERVSVSQGVIIEDNVWIGESACILPGVTIGFGSIIGALSVVSKSIPPYSIAVGNPAKIVKKYDFLTNKWIKL